MSIRAHITAMFVATIISWIGWILVVTNVNPFEAQWWGFGLFYSTLFLALFGTFAVLGFLIRSMLATKRVRVRNRLSISFRQAFLWTLALISTLVLQSQRVLTWWVFVILITIFVLIELMILSLQQQQQKNEE